MRADWSKGTPLLVKTVAGGRVAATVERYEGECFYLVTVKEGVDAGRSLVVHEDDATRDESASAQ